MGANPCGELHRPAHHLNTLALIREVTLVRMTTLLQCSPVILLELGKEREGN